MISFSKWETSYFPCNCRFRVGFGCIGKVTLPCKWWGMVRLLCVRESRFRLGLSRAHSLTFLDKTWYGHSFKMNNITIESLEWKMYQIFWEAPHNLYIHVCIYIWPNTNPNPEIYTINWKLSDKKITNFNFHLLVQKVQKFLIESEVL